MDVPGSEGIGVSAFFVADHAEAVNGKLYVNGGSCDTLYVSTLPATHPHLSVAAVLRVPWGATERSHGIEVRVVDQDGQEIVPPARGEFNAGRPAGMEPHEETTVVLVVNLINLPIAKTGPHRFELSVDGSPTAQTRIKIVERGPG